MKNESFVKNQEICRKKGSQIFSLGGNNPCERQGETIQLPIHDLGHQGEGVGYWEQKAIFVSQALPGETVSAEIVDLRQTHGFAKLLSIITPSPDRITPPCPLFGKCGGCQLMHLSYEKQLEMKRLRVKNTLERIGKIEDCEVLPCRPSPLPLAYRNKIQLPVQGGVMGLYAKGSHEIVAVDRCLIHCEQGEEALAKIKDVLIQIPQLRHVLIKSAIHTGETLLVLVTSDLAPSQELRQMAQRLLQGSIKGVIHNSQPSLGNTILGKSFETAAGASQIHEKMGGLEFGISAASFFQVNPLQAENLYLEALLSSGAAPSDVVLDAYCGVGTFSLFFAKHVKKVIGVESVPEAIADAKENAARNQIQNVSFVCAKAEKYIQKLSHIDLLLLNPPRKGCDPTLLQAVSRILPSKIVYVSCDAATLARDLQELRKMGYQIEKIQPFDMFPQTAHVECLVKLYYSSYTQHKKSFHI